VAESLAAHDHLELSTEAAIIALSVATFLAVAWITKVITGVESLTYYHHEIAVLTVAGLFAAAVGVPVLAHLDVTALGLGAFLALGRIGCLRVGCCHGRPARRGVRYGAIEVEAGFPAYLQGVTLIPVQGIESAAATLIVAAGATWSLLSDTRGIAFSLYVAAYAIVRFALEELRADTARRYLRGLSEAQWTSLAVVGAEVLAGLTGVLPGGGIGLVAAVLLVIEVGVVAVRRSGPSALFDARHVREVAGAGRALRATRKPGAGPVAVCVTSGGVRISAGSVGAVCHYTLSRKPDPLALGDAQRLATVLGGPAPPAPPEVVAGPASTFHVLISRPASRSAPAARSASRP
jgi:hypothetical protein